MAASKKESQPKRPQQPSRPCQRKSALHQCRQECQARRQPPTAKNIAIHRLVTEEHLSQRAVASKFGISQKRVHDIVKYVNRWKAEHCRSGREGERESGGAGIKTSTLNPNPNPDPSPSPPPPLTPSPSPPPLPPPLTLRDLLQKELAAIEVQMQDVQKKMALAEEKYEASVVVLMQGKEEVWTKTTTRRDPPRVGWESLLARLGRERAKVQRALLEAESQREPGEGEGGSGREGDAVSPPPPHSPSPTPLPFPAYPLSEDSSRACACTAKGRACPCVKSVEKELCGPCRKVVGHMRPAEGARHWSYHALGVRQELRDRDREKFVKLVTAIDDLADDADAMARAEASLRETTSPPHPLTPSPPPKAEGESGREGEGASVSLPALRREYFERLLDLDGDYAPGHRQSVLDRYDAQTGQVNWWLPGRIFRHEENLEWISEPRDQDDENARGGEGELGRGGENSFPSPSLPLNSSPPPAPLPPPATFTPEERDSWINRPGDKRVVLVRLSDAVNIGRTLADMCIEQESVVIYEQVEDYVKCGVQNAECGVEETQISSPMSKAGEETECGLGTVDCGPNATTAHTPQSALRNPHLPLTPALRDALYEQVGDEGVAVFGLDGRIYTGPSLGQCGLPHRGVLILRELCHSTPPWGESPWINFKPRKREQRGEVSEQREGREW